MRYVLEADRRTGKMAAQRIARLPKGTLPKRAPPAEARSPGPHPHPHPDPHPHHNHHPNHHPNPHPNPNAHQVRVQGCVEREARSGQRGRISYTASDDAPPEVLQDPYPYPYP